MAEKEPLIKQLEDEFNKQNPDVRSVRDILTGLKFNKEVGLEVLKVIVSLGVTSLTWRMIQYQQIDNSPKKSQLLPGSGAVATHPAYLTYRWAIRGLLNYGQEGIEVVKNNIPRLIEHPYIPTVIKNHFVSAAVKEAQPDIPVDILGTTAGLGLRESIDDDDLKSIFNQSLQELKRSEEPLDPALEKQLANVIKSLS